MTGGTQLCKRLSRIAALAALVAVAVVATAAAADFKGREGWQGNLNCGIGDPSAQGLTYARHTRYGPRDWNAEYGASAYCSERFTAVITLKKDYQVVHQFVASSAYSNPGETNLGLAEFVDARYTWPIFCRYVYQVTVKLTATSSGRTAFFTSGTPKKHC